MIAKDKDTDEEATMRSSLVGLQTQVALLNAEVKNISENLSELKKQIADVKEAIYEPEKGLYAKLVKIDTKANKHQIWFDVLSKGFWLIIGVIITTVAKYFSRD